MRISALNQDVWPKEPNCEGIPDCSSNPDVSAVWLWCVLRQSLTKTTKSPDPISLLLRNCFCWSFSLSTSTAHTRTRVTTKFTLVRIVYCRHPASSTLFQATQYEFNKIEAFIVILCLDSHWLEGQNCQLRDQAYMPSLSHFDFQVCSRKDIFSKSPS